MRRRDFIKVITGSAAAWPLAARAQQRDQMRRVTVLLGGLEFYDASGQAEVAAFEGGLKELGWTPGRNVDLDYHWPGAQTARVRAVANEIVAAHPDLVVSRSPYSRLPVLCQPHIAWRIFNSSRPMRCSIGLETSKTASTSVIALLAMAKITMSWSVKSTVSPPMLCCVVFYYPSCGASSSDPPPLECHDPGSSSRAVNWNASGGFFVPFTTHAPQRPRRGGVYV